FVFSDLHARRLREEGLRGEPIKLSGLYDGSAQPDEHASDPHEPLVVFAGRHIPEKRADVLPGALAKARERVPDLRGVILGDGPERSRVLRAISDAGADGYVTAPGFVSSEEIGIEFARAGCHVLPSSREGYGMVVIEAAANGTPTVVVAGEDNAAAELIEHGVNGYVASSVEALPDAIVRVLEEGVELRRKTTDWFRANAEELSARSSAHRIAEEYANRHR